MKKHGQRWVPVGESCQEIHSTSVCSPGKWLVRNRVTRYYECQRMPCGGNKYMVALKNGTCVPWETLHELQICRQNEEIFLTKYGYIECDCKDTFALWPADGHCYQLYTRGPCARGQILGVHPGQRKVECISNPCHSDDFVALDPLDGQYCYKLGNLLCH
jgi:hypothetical protein